MKLLLDQNLSPRLIEQLAEIYPGSTHVQSVNLDRASDEAVWNYARQNDYLIVTKDSDFHERSILLGPPPKIVWIRRGNCSTQQIAQILRNHSVEIQMLTSDDQATSLIII